MGVALLVPGLKAAELWPVPSGSGGSAGLEELETRLVLQPWAPDSRWGSDWIS